MEGLRKVLSRTRKAVIEGVADFRYILLMVGLVLGLSLLSQLAMQSGIVSRDQLTASPTNVPGVFPAVVSHYDWTRLAENSSALIAYTALFILTNAFEERLDRERRSWWLAVLAYPAAVVVNLAIIVVYTGGSLGASGLINVELGVAFVFFWVNTWSAVHDLIRLRRKQPVAREGGLAAQSLLWNGFCVLLFMFLLEFDQKDLFGLGDPTVSPQAHAIGFGIGGGLTLVWFLWTRRSQEDARE